MPDILIRQVLVANTPVRPFAESETNWRFRRCPYGKGRYTILVRTTRAAGDMTHSVLIGTTEVVQDSDTSVGATDGVMPTPAGAQATPAHQFDADAGDEINLLLSPGAAVGGAAMIWANVEPIA